MVVARADKQELVVIRECGRKSDCCGTVALAGLEDDRRCVPGEGAQVRLLGAICNDNRCGELLAKASERVFEQAALAK